MATTYQEYTGNASTTTFSYPFPVLKTEDIKVALNGVTQTTGYTATTSPAQVVFSSAPASGVVVRVYRDTDVDSAKGVYAAGSSIRAVDLNNNQDQVLYALQEEQNQKGIFESISLDDDVKIKLGNSDDFTIEWDSSASDALLTVAGDYTVDATGGYRFKVGGSQKLFLNNGEFISYQTFKPDVDDSIDLGTSSAQWRNLYVDGTGYIDTISADNITVSGTVDGRDVAADGTKLDGIEASATADQTDAEIRTAVEAASDSNVFTDADHSKLNAIEASATADQTASEIKTLLQSDKLTISEMNTTSLDGRYYTESEADSRFYNVASTEEIQSGETWVAADDKVATTSAIDNRIVDLLDDVGGFVPIANETSFPNANPDINNGAGTLISVPLANNLTSNGSGVISISNGTVGNSTVTINGAANSTTYTQGFGIIVETTSTLNTYTFHRYVPKATEVTTVAGNTTNINTVAGAIANVNTVAGISSNVTTVAGDTTAINNITTNLSAVQGAATNATNAASSATAAASSATSAGTSATTATTQATNAATSASTASTQATNAGNSATTATTQASNASTSAANALAYKDLALTYRNDASGILTQAESIPYNLVDSASTHTAWGNITDTGVVAFANETSNTLLSMSEGSATYNYGSIT